MNLLFLSLLSGHIADIASSTPIVNGEGEEIRAPLIPRDAACNSISQFVSVLQRNEATSFCSSYLDAATQTFSAAEVVSKTITETANTAIYTTSYYRHRRNKTVATLPTVVSISVVPSVSTPTQTLNAAPTTTTIYTTSISRYTRPPCPTENLEKRAVRVPAYAGGFASPVISQGCSCLSIPAPCITETITKTTTNAATITLVGSCTSTIFSTTIVTVTDIRVATLFVLATSFSTSISTTRTTTTVTPTVIISKPLPACCQYILTGNGLYEQAYLGANGG
ncbi:hypothetical protein TWF281_008897 [Arthrobotrys megalospora]